MRLQRMVPFGAFLLLFGVTACQSPEAEPEMAAEVPTETEMVNALTEAEQAEGWQLLFDGQSTAGWRGYMSDSVPGQWSAQDGALRFDPSVDAMGGDIITENEYESFELTLDWKIAECGNSGLFFHVVEDPQYAQTYHTGPEMQVLDNACHPDAANAPDRWAGANYALHAPAYAEQGFAQKEAGGALDSTTNLVRPAGEWNHVRLVVDGPHVEHWLNGEKIVDYELWSDDWKQRVANSKFTEWPDYGMARSGHIALQDHGDAVWYRNIKIRPLGQAEQQL